MRKCIRCGSEMQEGYGLKVSSLFAGVAPILLSKGHGILSDELGKIKVAVCPGCGEISLYFDQLDKIGRKNKQENDGNAG